MNMEKGITKIKVVKMYDKCPWGDGIDHQVRSMNGNTYLYDFTDDAGQIWVTDMQGNRVGLAINPECDEFVVL